MSKTETIVTFANRRQEIERLKRKNSKERFAYTIAKIHDVLNDADLVEYQKINDIGDLITESYW
jgi:hypothetical protein